ncbi:hypothetical protein ACO0R3_002344 [Hanseniaspora guilliermondii]
MSTETPPEKKPLMENLHACAAIDVSGNKIGIAVLKNSKKTLSFLESDYSLNRLDKVDECVNIIGFLIESYTLNNITFSSRVDDMIVDATEKKMKSKFINQDYTIETQSLKTFTSKKIMDIVSTVLMEKSDADANYMYIDSESSDKNKFPFFSNMIEGINDVCKLTFGCVCCLMINDNKTSSNETLVNNNDTSDFDNTRSNNDINESSIHQTISDMIVVIEHLPISDNNFTMDDDTIFSLQILPQSLTNHQLRNNQKSSVYSLAELLGQKVKTELGKDTLIKWILNPLKNTDIIRSRHDFIEMVLKNYENYEFLCNMINNLPNINRILYNFHEGKISVKNWLNLKLFLTILLDIEIFLKQNKLEVNSYFEGFLEVLESLNLTSFIDSILSFFNSEKSVAEQKIVIEKEFNSELDHFIQTYESLDVLLAEKAEILNNQLEELFNKSFNLAVMYAPQLGFLVSVKKSTYEHYLTDNNLGFSYIFGTKTHVFLKNLMMEDLDNTYNDIYNVISDMEMELTLNFQNEIFKIYNGNLNKCYKYACKIEVLLSFSSICYSNNYKRPIFTLEKNHDNKKVLILNKARHPIYETINESHIPNDYKSWDETINNHKNIAVITGANMSGKTMFMLTIGLNVLLAQIGCFVSCESMELSPVDMILTKINTRESISKLKSNFILDCQQLNKCLKKTTEHSLILIDEFGKGTNVIDGPSLFGSVLFYLIDTSCRAILCTHFHELFSDIVLGKDEVIEKNINFFKTEIVFGETQEFITFLYKIRKGISFRSFGVACAKYCNLNENVVADANVIYDLMVDNEKSKKTKMADLLRFVSNMDENNLNEEYSKYKTKMIDFLKEEF